MVRGEILEQTRRRTRFILRKGQQGGACQGIVQALQLAAGNRTTHQAVANHLEVNAALPGFGSQMGHFPGGQAAVVRQDGGLRLLRRRAHLLNNLLLLFKP